MVSQNIWIGITVGIFFLGLGIGYVALQSSTVSPMMTNQQMQYMMNNPQSMNQWHQQMVQNPQAMNQWMQYMMDNPQMMQSIMNNPQFQQNWMAPWLNNSTNWDHMMNSGWMNQHMNYGMIDSSMMGGHMMMGTPITQQNDVLNTIDNIEKILDDVSTNYSNGNQDTALSLATTVYLENYEYIEGAIAQKDRLLMEKIELMLRIDLRSMIKNGDTVDNVNTKISLIKDELAKVKPLFQ